MPVAPAVQMYLGDSRNGLSESGFADATGFLLDSSNGQVKVSITRVSDGGALATNVACTYSGTPGTWTLPDSATQAAWFPRTDRIVIVWTGMDLSGSITYLTKTVPARPQPPIYMSYKRLSRRSVSFSPGNLVGLASATATLQYQSGAAPVGPTTLGGSAAPFTYTVSAAAWLPGDTITIVLAATDTLGLAYTQVIVAQDDGD